MAAADHDPHGYVTDVAYLPGSYPYMAPHRMRYVLAVNGIPPPVVRDGYRYLELGCGFGGTLLALAAANPHATFTGIDFMPVHTDHIRREAEAAGLTNVRVVCDDFLAIREDLPQFDFITMHGVFSWVSPALRAAVLGIAARHIAPGGIVEVSYNALPGWSSLLPVRSLIRNFAARADGDSVTRVKAALAAVAEMRRADTPVFHDQPLAAQLVDRLLGADPHYLAHEYLNEHWVAFEAGEVIGMFAAAGLPFAGRLPYHRNHRGLSVLPRFSGQFAGLDAAAAETLQDLHDNTMFRWDLFSATPRRRWSPHERAAATDDLWFRVAHDAASLPHTVTYGSITAGLAGPPHDQLLAVMGRGGWTLGRLLAEPALADVPAEALVEAVDEAVALGLFSVDGGAALDEVPAGEEIAASPLTVPLLFNRRAIARVALANTTVGLASPLTGAAHDLGDLHALLLDELVAGGRPGLEERIAARLAGLGKHLRREATNAPLADADATRQATAEIVSEFLDRVLPNLVRLGIVVAAD